MNCPRCGQPAKYMEQQGTYFCVGCKEFLEGTKPSGDVAPMKRRTAAFLVDMLVVMAVTSGLLLALPRFSIGPLVNTVTLTFFSVMGLYFVIFHSHSGQTPGKQLFHLRVAIGGTSPLPVEVSILRYLLKAISMVLLCLGLLWAFFNSDHRGWHDRFAETLVLEA